MAHCFNRSSESNFIQWIAALTVFMMQALAGIYYGWLSPNTARLLSKNSPIPCTPADISWLVSLSPIGSFLGAIVGSMLVEYIGSRKTLLVTYAFMGLSWICILIASSIVFLCIGRTIGGISSSMLQCCFSIYLSEISAPAIRGTLISLTLVGGSFGNLFGIIAETYLPLNVPSWIYLMIVLVGMIFLLFMKDTPYYLVKKGDMENAEKATLLYRKRIKVEEELKEIRAFAENSNDGIRNKFMQLQSPAVRRALIMIAIAFTLPDASGIMTVVSYTEIILKTTGFNLVEPDKLVVYSSILSVIFSFSTVSVLDKLGRRFALGISSFGTAVALTVLGLHFYLLKSGSDVKNFQWLSVGSLLSYSIAFNIGFASVPSTLLSEMFPQNFKSIAGCLGNLIASICAFVVVKSYQPVVDWVGEAYLFWAHAALSMIGVPCALFLLMETKGKTFQQIQDELEKK